MSLGDFPPLEFFKKDFIYLLILETGEGREKEREGKINV